LKLNLISLSIVKSQLGLVDTTYDSQITAMIPIVSADVRRILNCEYNDYSPATYTNGSTELDVYNQSATSYKKYIGRSVPLSMGQVVTGENIPDDTYIISVDPDTGNYTMSAEATGSGDYIYPTITISQWPTISKMIMYRIAKTISTDSGDDNFVSRSVGPLNINLGQSAINKRWNYPQKLIDDLGIPYTEVG
jgi:hypothetical protein